MKFNHLLMRSLFCFTQVANTTSVASQDAPAEAARDVEFLTSPTANGRGYLHEGHLVAARYIRDGFTSAGLQPLGNGYLQPFTVSPDLFYRLPSLSINGRALRPGRDFIPVPGATSGAGRSVPVARAGFGLAAPESGHDDFGADSFRRRAVFVNGGLPDSLKDVLAPDVGRTATKAKAAAAAGASLLVVITDRLTFGQNMPDVEIPVFEILASAIPESVTDVAYEVHATRNVKTTAVNVAGLIRGTAAPDSLILLTAHYDHLGALGDSLYFPGANDNASGTALLLDLARQFGARPPRYSVAFVAFSGEELGLLGSRFFIANPLVQLSEIVLVLNFDMVGSGEAGIVVSGGTDFPDFYERLSAVNDDLQLGRIRPRPATPISDHYPFVDAGIPALYLYTDSGQQPYHHVDDVAATLEWDDYVRVRELVLTFIYQLQ